MPLITSREQLIEYALRALGAPVIEINVSPEQLEDRVDDAIQFYREYHSDAVIRTFAKHQVTEQDIANKYIQIPEQMLGVLRVLPIGASGSSNRSNIFSFEYQTFLNNLWQLRSPADLVQFEITKQHLQLLDRTINGMAQDIRFSRHMNRLYIDAVWGERIRKDDWIVVEGIVAIDPDEYTDVYNDMFLKRYLVALVKRQWGINLMKFEGMQLPGGVTLNGRQIFDDATAELQQIEEQVQLRFETPVDFFVG